MTSFCGPRRSNHRPSAVVSWINSAATTPPCGARWKRCWRRARSWAVSSKVPRPGLVRRRFTSRSRSVLAPSSGLTSCCSRSARGAWASSSWRSSRPGAAAGSRSRSSSPAWTSRQVIARFEAERQALAMMDHPNIARVLDAGDDERRPALLRHGTGQGHPDHQFCDENKLTPRQRLELFIPVCQAIQHAHQKGIIHRDIKPSNVLVTLYDDKPVPKVIDFGVAKAVEPAADREDDVHRSSARSSARCEYMSPEQAEMNALDVDTPQRHLCAGRVAVRAAHRHDAPGKVASAQGRVRRNAAADPGRGAAAAKPRLSSSGRRCRRSRQRGRPSRPSSRAGPRGDRLDRHEVSGEGSLAALRHGQRPGPRR